MHDRTERMSFLSESCSSCEGEKMVSISACMEEGIFVAPIWGEGDTACV